MSEPKLRPPGKAFMRETLVTGKFAYGQRWAYNTSAAPNNMLAITRTTTAAVNHLERMAVRKNDALPSARTTSVVRGESSSGRGAWGATGWSTYVTLPTKL